MPCRPHGFQHTDFVEVVYFNDIIRTVLGSNIPSLVKQSDTNSGLTIMVVGTTPEDERDFGVESGG